MKKLPIGDLNFLSGRTEQGGDHVYKCKNRKEKKRMNISEHKDINKYLLYAETKEKLYKFEETSGNKVAWKLSNHNHAKTKNQS